MEVLMCLRCYGCNKLLDSAETDMYETTDGMCDECYSESMETVYEDFEGDE